MNVQNKPRFELIDALRGFAIVLMIFFHFFFDLHLYGIIRIDLKHGFWFFFPRIIIFIFLFCAGFSLKISHDPTVNWKKFFSRLINISLGAIFVSAFTYIFASRAWIYFGILHCMVICSLLTIPVINKPKIMVCAILVILFMQFVLGYNDQSVFLLINKPSFDFTPVYPWLWAMLLGAVSAPWLVSFPTQLQRGSNFLSLLGRNSLRIYLLHQFVLLGLVKFIIFASTN